MSYRWIQNSTDYSMMWRFKNAYSELKRTTVQDDKKGNAAAAQRMREMRVGGGGGPEAHYLKLVLLCLN